jgi:asparagine N-glycosylation enzyme membrane subunit Stt3
VGRDLPIAAFAAASTIGLAKVAIDLADGISDYVWDQTRQDAENALGGLIEVMMALTSGSLGFAAPLLGLFLIFAMLFMWIVLFIRESLIYLVIIYAVAFGFPAMLFPPLRDTSKKVLELLVALIIAKPVMVLAMSVGLSGLGGVGATGQPGDGVGDNIAKELGTMIVGVVVFGLAAFMPYLTWKLMPVVAVAVVAQGVASSPMRGVTQAAQLQYYGSNAMKRMTGPSGSSRSGSAGDSAGGVGNGGAPGGGPTGGSGPSGGAGPSGMAGGAAGGGAAAGGSTAGTAAASPAAGPAAPMLVAAAAAKAGGDAAKNVAGATAETVTSRPNSSPTGGPPPAGGSERDVSGGS